MRATKSARTGWRGGTLRRDQGNITMASLGVGMACAVAILVGAMFITYVFAVHQARHGADLAALAAAGRAVQMADESQACERAGEVASQNNAELVSCEVVRVGVEVAVRVEVAVGLTWPVPGLPDTVSSVSYAGNPED